MAETGYHQFLVNFMFSSCSGKSINLTNYFGNVMKQKVLLVKLNRHRFEYGRPCNRNKEAILTNLGKWTWKIFVTEMHNFGCYGRSRLGSVYSLTLLQEFHYVKWTLCTSFTQNNKKKDFFVFTCSGGWRPWWFRERAWPIFWKKEKPSSLWENQAASICQWRREKEICCHSVSCTSYWWGKGIVFV